MSEVFYNPLLPAPHPDPWVLYDPPWYWYCGSAEGHIYLLRAERLQDLARSQPIVVWTAPRRGENAHHIWAPELHLVDDRWVIYYAADDGLNANHRMYVLESTTSPLGPYEDRGKICTDDDHWAIDGTVLHHPDGSRYLIWSGWESDENVQQNLYIAPMDRDCAWRLLGPRVMISAPDQPWEQHGRPWVNEAPEVVVRDDAIYVFYSASGSWTPDYCLGVLRCSKEHSVLDPTGWQKVDHPVFAKDPDAQVFGVGHASFVRDANQTWWIVYHAMDHPDAGWAGRSARIQPFLWPQQCLPQLGRPWALDRPVIS